MSNETNFTDTNSTDTNSTDIPVPTLDDQCLEAGYMPYTACVDPLQNPLLVFTAESFIFQLIAWMLVIYGLCRVVFNLDKLVYSIKHRKWIWLSMFAQCWLSYLIAAISYTLFWRYFNTFDLSLLYGYNSLAAMLSFTQTSEMFLLFSFVEVIFTSKKIDVKLFYAWEFRVYVAYAFLSFFIYVACAIMDEIDYFINYTKGFLSIYLATLEYIVIMLLYIRLIYLLLRLVPMSREVALRRTLTLDISLTTLVYAGINATLYLIYVFVVYFDYSSAINYVSQITLATIVGMQAWFNVTMNLLYIRVDENNYETSDRPQTSSLQLRSQNSDVKTSSSSGVSV